MQSISMVNIVQTHEAQLQMISQAQHATNDLNCTHIIHNNNIIIN